MPPIASIPSFASERTGTACGARLEPLLELLVVPWHRPSASAGVRVSRRRARAACAQTAASTDLQSDPPEVSSAERIRSRANERSSSGIQEMIPRSARQRVRLSSCDLRPAAQDPVIESPHSGEWVYVGNVLIDTGRLALVDPPPSSRALLGLLSTPCSTFVTGGLR